MSGSKPVALVIGASRGIGRQIAIDLAKSRYAVVVAAKSISSASSSTTPSPPDPNSAHSTITTVEQEIKEAGGEAVAIAVDVRDFPGVKSLVRETIKADVLIYNPGAIWWASVEDTPMKRFQLMQRVNPEGLYGAVQAALPHLKRSRAGGRIIVISPPIYSRFFRGKTAYAMGKVGMSVLTKGLAMDFERQGLVRPGEEEGGMAVTSIWPAVAIESAATEQFVRQNPDQARDLRKPTVLTDAILAILRAPASVVNGQLLLDEDFLREYCGVTEFSRYSVVPGSRPRRIMPAKLPDLTVMEQDEEGNRYDSAKARRVSRL